MRAIHDRIKGPLTIDEDLAIYGMVTKGATLAGGRKLVLHGTIAGDLIIERGARAIIHGTVAGRVQNKGGRAEIFGMANSIENLAPDAVTIINPSAHVRRAFL